jgi:hypothetical protein
MKRPWKWRILELLFWAAIAVGTAVVLVALSDSILPANF